MIIGVSLSTITSVNAYNYNKNAFENTDELKIIYNQIAKKEKSINACSLNSQAVYKCGYPTTKGRILVTGDAYKNLIPTGHAAIVYSQNRVVEAVYNKVVTGKNDWNQSKNTCWGNVIKLRVGCYQGIQTKCMPFLFSLDKSPKM